MKKILLLGCLFTSSLLANPFGDEDPIGNIVMKRSQNPDWAQRGVVGEIERGQDEKWTIATLQGVVKMYQPVLPQREQKLLLKNDIEVDAHHWRSDKKLNALYRSSHAPSEPRHFLQFDEAVIRNEVLSTSQSRQIASHEMGHLILSVLKPAWCRECRVQTGSFDESFGDISTILYSLWSPDLQDGMVNSLRIGKFTLGNDIGYPIRTIGGTASLDEIGSCEVHDLSVPFTNAVFYSIRRSFFKRREEHSLACASSSISQEFANILVQGVLRTDGYTPSFSEIALNMLRSTKTHRNVLGRCFINGGILSIQPYIGGLRYIPGDNRPPAKVLRRFHF